VVVNVPLQVPVERVVHCRRRLRQVDGGVMFEAVLADEIQKILQVRDVGHTKAAERIERIVGQLSLAHVGGDLAAEIVGGDAAEGEWLGAHAPTTVPYVLSLPTVPAMIA